MTLYLGQISPQPLTPCVLQAFFYDEPSLAWGWRKEDYTFIMMHMGPDVEATFSERKLEKSRAWLLSQLEDARKRKNKIVVFIHHVEKLGFTKSELSSVVAIFCGHSHTKPHGYDKITHGIPTFNAGASWYGVLLTAEWNAEDYKVHAQCLMEATSKEQSVKMNLKRDSSGIWTAKVEGKPQALGCSLVTYVQDGAACGPRTVCDYWLRCIDGTCQKPKSPNAKCERDNDCASRKCNDGKCGPRFGGLGQPGDLCLLHGNEDCFSGGCGDTRLPSTWFSCR